MRYLNKKDLCVLKGNFEVANYKEQELTEYVNNPFIEALPSIFTDDDTIKKFLYIPKFEDSEKSTSKNVRFHLLNRIKNYSQVLPIHIILANKLSTMIRRGYLARNPLNFNYLEKLGILNEIKSKKPSTYKDIDNKMKFMRSTAESFTILGISGIGKTTAVERLLLMYPQVIKHQMYNGSHFTRAQIVWMKIDCPYDGSLGTLCKSFFQAIDNILGTNYYEKFGYSSRITSSMMLSMSHLSSMYGIGILVIDEIQQLINTKNNPEEMLNFFVTLSNTVGVPTVLIGTPKAKELFSGNFRQARRASSEGNITWGRMEKESRDWVTFVKTLWRLQCLQDYTELTETLNNVFYEETQGITSVAVNLFILSQEAALMEGKEKLTKELIKETSKKYLKLLQPMLKAIKSNIEKDIAKYDDISIDYKSISNTILYNLELSKRMEKIYEEKTVERENKRKNRLETLLIDIKTLNIFPKFSDEDLLSIISKEVDSNPLDLDYDELKGFCIKKAVYKYDNLNRDNKKRIKPQKDDSLIKLYDYAINNKQHPYEILLKHGYIKNPADELVW